MTWGIEGAVNFGEADVKAWDRNYTTIAKNDDGVLFEQFTKVYTQDPATTKNPKLAPNTKAIAALLDGSPHDRAMNGKLVGTVGADNIYNAFHRFRPAQQRNLCGYFFVADADYWCIDKVFKCALGVGYASGYIDQQRDTNKMTDQELFNEQFTGFVPLQSVYSGKRLRHLVLFNQGVPRFNVKDPNASLDLINNTQVLQSDTVNEMTNVAFIGTRFDWRVQALKKYAVNIAQNIICYWSPETAHVVISNVNAGLLPNDPKFNPSAVKTTQQSHNFIGTEFSTEISALFYDKIKIAGYFGVLFPGNHYKDMAGTLIGKNKLPTGSDLGYVGNIGAAYFF